MKLSYRARKRLPSSAFALERKRKYPIHDRSHARNALARVSAYGIPYEKKEVRREVCQKYPDMGSCEERREKQASLVKSAISASDTQRGLVEARRKLLRKLNRLPKGSPERRRLVPLIAGVAKNLADPHGPGGVRG